MKNIFVAMGGSGSSHLASNIMEVCDCALRPDKFFAPLHYSEEVRQKDIRVQSVQDLKVFPSEGAAKGFYERTKEHLNIYTSVNDNLVTYIHYLQATNNRTAVFSRAFEFNFFSENSINDLVFLIRHPLNTYLSLSDECRHPEIFKSRGGQHSIKSIGWFADIWCKLVDEAISCLDSTIITFESEDKPEHLQYAFKKWKYKQARLSTVLDDNLISYMNLKTLAQYKKIYAEDWFNGIN